MHGMLMKCVQAIWALGKIIAWEWNHHFAVSGHCSSELLDNAK